MCTLLLGQALAGGAAVGGEVGGGGHSIRLLLIGRVGVVC